jgi:hypothetical protein
VSARAWCSLAVFGWWLLVTVVAVDALWRSVPPLDVAVFAVGGYGLPVVFRWMALAQDRYEAER